MYYGQHFAQNVYEITKYICYFIQRLHLGILITFLVRRWSIVERGNLSKNVFKLKLLIRSFWCSSRNSSRTSNSGRYFRSRVSASRVSHFPTGMTLFYLRHVVMSLYQYSCIDCYQYFTYQHGREVINFHWLATSHSVSPCILD